MLPEIDFCHAIFNGKTDFYGAEFGGHAYFIGTIFLRDAGFGSAVFVKDARFTGAFFHSEASFYSTKFNSKAVFSGTRFLGEVHFMDVEFSSYAWFCNTLFKSAASMYDISMNRCCKIIIQGLEAESLENVIFKKSDLNTLAIGDCEWPNRLGAEKYRTGYSVYFASLLECEELYRAMKQRAAEEHDQPQVSRWHFREKLMQLMALINNKQSHTFLEVIENQSSRWPARAKAWFKLFTLPPYLPKLTLTGLYWATSGFGERAVRAGVWLLALVALSFIANSITEPWVWAELPGSAAAQYTLATIPFAKDIPGDGWVKVGRGVWQFLIAVQFTLFALAVRNRFRR